MTNLLNQAAVLREKESGLAWDYSQIDPGVAADVRGAAVSIKSTMTVMADGMVEIGHQLIQVKNLLGHGQFLDWIDVEFSMADRMANHFMNVARRLGDKSENFSDLGRSALYALAAPSTPDSAIDEIGNRLDAGERPNLADVRETIADHKEPPAPPVMELPGQAPAPAPDPVAPTVSMTQPYAPGPMFLASGQAATSMETLVGLLEIFDQAGNEDPIGNAMAVTYKRNMATIQEWLDELGRWVDSRQTPVDVVADNLPPGGEWVDADQTQYRRLSKMEWLVADITRPEVALRLARDEDPELRGVLMTRYWALKGVYA